MGLPEVKSGKHESRDGKSRKEDKHKKKSKKHKKEKDSKKKRTSEKSKKSKTDHSRHYSDSSSSDSSSASDIELLSPKEQLQRERQAVNVMRDLLWTHNSAKKDLRDLLWTIDQGKAANISGVPDETLKEQIRKLFKLLGLVRAGSKGSYQLSPGRPTTLSILSFVFDEQPRPPPEHKQKASPPKGNGLQPHETDTKQKAASIPSQGQATAQHSKPTSQPPSNHNQGPIDADTIHHSRNGKSTPPDQQEEGNMSDNPAVPTATSKPAAKVVGPAMPSREMLEAAAAEAAALAAYEAQRAAEEHTMPGDVFQDEDLIGPVPPELQEELDAVPEDAREAEVVRIMRLLREAAMEKPSASAAGTPAVNTQAYAVLGVEPDTSSSDIKKRYMRLSLLIHPDKCHHKDAHEAFQAVAQAAKVLQDAGGRAAVDAAREDAELRRMAAAAAVAMERKRQWQIARGEVPTDSIGATSQANTQITRESWMTELPPEHSAVLGGGPMSQVSQRSFNRFGVKPRGDTSEWTDTPQEKAAKASGQVPQTAGPLLIRGAPEPGSHISSSDTQLLKAYESKNRKKSLLEQHMESQGKDSPVGKKAKVEGTPAGHPWRPFDREKDVELKPKAADPAQLLKQQAVLGSRFASAGSSRKFL